MTICFSRELLGLNLSVLGGLEFVSTSKVNLRGEAFPHTYKLSTSSVPIWDNLNNYLSSYKNYLKSETTDSLEIHPNTSSFANKEYYTN
jgi:hypothetical protein